MPVEVLFDEQFYLNHYKDVRDAVIAGIFDSGGDHYLSTGKAEGRYPNEQAVPKASAALDNISGHRNRYELLKGVHPIEDVGKIFVGGSDPILTGYAEIESIRCFGSLERGEYH